MTWYTYLAVHPTTKVPAYAGITSEISTGRLPKVVRTRPIRIWIKQLANTGMHPEIVIQGSYLTWMKAAEHLDRLITSEPNLLNRRAPPP